MLMLRVVAACVQSLVPPRFAPWSAGRRIISATTARVLDISTDGASWRVIATDGGLLPEPYATNRIVLAPGQRYDLEVTYNQCASAARLLHVLAEVDRVEQEVARPVAEYTISGDANADLPVYPAVTLPAITDAPLDREFRLGATARRPLSLDLQVGDGRRIRGRTRQHPPPRRSR